MLVLLSLLPMATMLSNMFTVHVGTEKKLLRLPVGSTTLWHFQKLFAGDDWSQVNFWQPLCNSLIVALGSGILGIAVGGTVAWFITRSDLKCKKFISAVSSESFRIKTSDLPVSLFGRTSLMLL